MHRATRRPRSTPRDPAPPATSGAAPGGGTPRGFTLMEMLIVLTVMSLVAALAVPKLDLSRYRSDAAVRLLRTTLQQSQRLSVQSQFDVVLSFDISQHRVRVIYDANNDGIASTGERVRWVPFHDGVRFSVAPMALPGAPSGLHVSGPALKTVDGMPTLTFHRNGAASTDAQIYLAAGRQLPRDFRVVTLVRNTGRTDWYRFAGNKWKPGGL
jgi:prepilin-type N-terminal cleavage/methylation domain-containing protein